MLLTVGHHHDHDHGHGHGHGHHHHTPPESPDRAYLIGVVLNVAFVVIEGVYGVLSGSVALLADAAHNLSDVLGLILAWTAVVLARRAPSVRRTYGLRKSTILAALANAALVLIAVGGVAWEATERFMDPQPVVAKTVIIVAAAGVFINTVSALFFMGGGNDVNRRAAFVHLAADAAVSFGVVLAGIAMWMGAGSWIDPLVSLAISVIIAWGTWRLLRQALDLALDAVPEHIDLEQVRASLHGIDGVADVHDLHVWPLSSTEVALTAHLEMHRLSDWTNEAAHEACRLLADLGIGHVTLQPEPVGSHGCAQAPDDVV